MLIDIREIPSLLSPLKVKKKCALFYHQPQKPIQKPTCRNAAGSNLLVYLVVLFLGGKPQTIV